MHHMESNTRLTHPSNSHMLIHRPRTSLTKELNTNSKCRIGQLERWSNSLPPRSLSRRFTTMSNMPKKFTLHWMTLSKYRPQQARIFSRLNSVGGLWHKIRFVLGVLYLMLSHSHSDSRLSLCLQVNCLHIALFHARRSASSPWMILTQLFNSLPSNSGHN
jgi:hypothetical protein